jgi:hypothetical protein
MQKPEALPRLILAGAVEGGEQRHVISAGSLAPKRLRPGSKIAPVGT